MHYFLVIDRKVSLQTGYGGLTPELIGKEIFLSNFLTGKTFLLFFQL